MLLCDVKLGYMYYHEIRERVEVPIDERLRTRVKKMIEEMYHYFQQSYTPKVQPSPACRRCSLKKDRKSTRLNSSHVAISYADFCLQKTSNQSVGTTTIR